ncbi:MULTISPECIES: TIGR03621 family F420-dependent LLM class oxidoreductase [Prauserella salsuginis group]|uniref:TIGR03621 family F420-dependent LLM class oxidoreductase n=1 Tax=Prauserella salsuginis TaxID=387889 RepID=A0ABW6G8P5_9PSEU|nr:MULTISPECIES: TIGR03621 family F420-dependent LLM class oxidoreductase [Prauserella salsuginis group]
MGSFRFGVSIRPHDGDWLGRCRRAEALGYDVIAVADHLGTGNLGPVPALAAAAAVTERAHLTPFVLNVPFYNASLLARDVHTVGEIAQGRFELGVGAGHMKAEFDAAGLPWRPARERVAQLSDTLAQLRAELGDAMPPLLVAGNSDAVLDLAAREADIVGFSGLRQLRGQPPGTFTLAGADELAERTDRVRRRSDVASFNLLVQHVAVTDEPAAALAAWQDGVPGLELSAAGLAAAPQLLAGTVDEIAEQLVGRRERYGFTYVTVFEPAMETFAPVMAALRGC